MKNAYNILIGKSERKRRLGKPKRRWKGNIIINIKEIGKEGVDLALAQEKDRLW